MPTFDLTTQLPEIDRHLRRTMEKAFSKGILSAAMRIVAVIKTEIIPQTPQLGADARVPFDRGIYTSAWEFQPIDAGAEVYNAAPHAPLIEDGVRAGNVKPGRAMIDALTQWVRRKGLVSRFEGRGSKRRLRLSHEVDAEARSIAWAIAMSMKRRGIFNNGGGLKVLARAMERAPKIIRGEIDLALARAGV